MPPKLKFPVTGAVFGGIDLFYVINEHVSTKMREDQAAQMRRLAGVQRANVLTAK